VFSLRPEAIRFGSPPRDAIHFRGRVLQQAFHGATELLRIRCNDSLELTVRAPSRDDWQGELDLEFAPSDVIPVRDSPERA
jgi:hypothetical protein